MIECVIANWGVQLILVVLLSFSEYLAKTKRFKENGIIDLVRNFIRRMVRGV